MTNLLPFVSFYVVFGLIFAIAERLHASPTIVGTVTTCLAWPFFAPFILGDALKPSKHAPFHIETKPMLSLGEQSEIDATLASFWRATHALDEMTKVILACHFERVERGGIYAKEMAQKLAQLDLMMDSPEFDADAVAKLQKELGDKGYGPEDDVLKSVLNRHRNIEHLHQLRRDTEREIERVMVCIDELTTQVALLQFNGGANSPQDRDVLDGLTLQIEQIYAQT